MNEFTGMFDVRDGNQNDKNFILATFLRGLYYGDTWYSLIPKQIFMDNYKHVAEKLITSPNIIVKVACLREDPAVILGYSVLSSDFKTIHWVHVKKAWRKRGIAKTILPQYPTYITHLSSLGKNLMTKFETAVFNPFAF